MCHPHVFIKMASDLGLVIIAKMTDIEASAMWVESNVSICVARIILRHLQSKFGVRLQVPFSKISLISNVTSKVQPVFDEFEYIKETDSCKVKENVKYWTVHPCDLLEQDLQD